MADQTQYVAAIGPLYNVPLVVVGVAFTAIAWSNGLEILFTTFTTFKKRSAYFYALIVAALGVLCFQTAVFCLVFARGANTYGITAGINVGWASMVTGQSVVLWSRLHLVCHSRWKLRAILIMIITNCLLLHGTQTVFSLLAIENNVLNPNYGPFVYMEKVSLCLFFAQEVIISSVYLMETIKVLRLSQLVKTGSKYLRMRNLMIATIAILLLDVALIAMEFSALWGVWCTFKGFAYSVKLKIEFNILNQLRDTIANPNGANSSHTGNSSGGGNRRHYGMPPAGPHGDVQLNSLGHQAKCFPNSSYGVKGNSVPRSGDNDQIMKTTEYTISHLNEAPTHPISKTNSRIAAPSPSSSEIDFASKGA